MADPLPLPVEDLAKLAALGDVDLEFDEHGHLRRLTRRSPAASSPSPAVPARHERSPSSLRLQTSLPATPDLTQCPACGASVELVVVVEGALTAQVMVQYHHGGGGETLFHVGGGVYEVRDVEPQLHAPRCPKWDGDTDWRVGAVRVPTAT
jgi:hypothetical protein